MLDGYLRVVWLFDGEELNHDKPFMKQFKKADWKYFDIDFDNASLVTVQLTPSPLPH